jgi:hypothetical protein
VVGYFDESKDASSAGSCATSGRGLYIQVQHLSEKPVQLRRTVFDSSKEGVDIEILVSSYFHALIGGIQAFPFAETSPNDCSSRPVVLAPATVSSFPKRCKINHFRNGTLIVRFVFALFCQQAW